MYLLIIDQLAEVVVLVVLVVMLRQVNLEMVELV
jgi:hypothetical protein